MAHRLGDSPEDKADAESGAEEHADPREKGIFGSFIISAKPDAAIFADGQE
ncbi:Uncharacterised protein [Mycobacteroides abscessus subsp. abscessus]|nr:Uncharacterised protein [Mycobacteroides abscessus subsp. abscessus]